MRLFKKDAEDDFNFWQSYTDLLFAIFAIFVVTTLLLAIRNTGLEDILKGNTKVDIEDAKRIKQIKDALSKISNSTYFEYNAKYERIEYKKQILFEPNKWNIPEGNENDLKASGVQLVELLNRWKYNGNVGFKIIIEGRAANNINNMLPENKSEVKILSYQRALSLYDLWYEEGIVQDLRNNPRVEILISGSGFEGNGRYTGKDEDKNKRFIIQVVPYILK